MMNFSSLLAMRESGYLFRDLMGRRFRVMKPWMCECAGVSEAQATAAIDKAMQECEEAQTRMNWRHYVGQKKPDSDTVLPIIPKT